VSAGLVELLNQHLLLTTFEIDNANVKAVRVTIAASVQLDM
jgi:hypothetical protein